MVNQQNLHFKGVAMNKYIISFVLDDNNKMETFTFDSAAERKKFFDSLRKDLPVKDVMFSEHNDELTVKEEGSDGMHYLIQCIILFFVFIHSFMGNDIFPILCLLALNEIANKILNRKDK